jgi:hypothetical protein
MPTYDEENGEVTQPRLQQIPQLIGRLMRKPNNYDRRGSTEILEQLEVSPISLNAVVPIAMSITKASVTDMRRIRNKIPLVYIWLDAYLMGNKGAKHYVQHVVKDTVLEQLAGEVKEPEIGDEE